MPRQTQAISPRFHRGILSGDFGKPIEQQGAEPATSTPVALLARIKSETERWRKVIKDAGLAVGG